MNEQSTTSTNMELNADLSFSRVDPLDLDLKLRLESTTTAGRPMTFHCDRCNAVVGDHLSVCGEFRSLGAIMFLKVTHSVSVGDQTESATERQITGCLQRSLECTRCDSVLGSVVVSSPGQLDMLRSVFLLHKEKINCYILKHSQVVKSSELVFELKPIGPSINAAMKKFQAQFDHMSRVDKLLRTPR